MARWQHSLGAAGVVALAGLAAPPAAAQWLPAGPTQRSLPAGAPTPPLESLCGEPTAAQCADPDFYGSPCGRLQLGADAGCNAHLIAAADAQTEPLATKPLTRCPVGIEVDVTHGQSCGLPPEEVDAYRVDYDRSAVDVSGNAASYAGELQAAQRDAVRGGVRGLLRNLRHTNWGNNCGVFSCEEFVREKYYAWSVFEDEVVALGDDHRAVYDLVFGPGGLAGREVPTWDDFDRDYSELSLSRLDGSDAPSLPLREPKRNIYLRFLDIDNCAFPPQADIETCERPYVINAGFWRASAALQRQTATCTGANDVRYPMTRETLDAGLAGFAQDVPQGTALQLPQPDLSYYKNVLSWHRDASAALAASGYADDYLLWWAERQVYFRSLWRDLDRLGEKTISTLCHSEYRDTRDAFFETAELLKRELEIAAQAGCLDAEHINPCDWSPRSLHRELLYSGDPTFARLNPEQAASFSSQRESDYQSCVASTGNNFDPVADSEWLVQAQHAQGSGDSQFCATSLPGGDCDARASYADSTRSVEAYFDAANQWFESLQLPRDPETGEPFVGDSHSDSGLQGDSDFRLDFGYGMSWAMTRLERQNLCEAELSVTGNLHADVTVFGYSTGGDSPHLALLETTVDSSPATTRGSAGFFIKGTEIFAPPELSSASRVYLTESTEYTDHLVGEYSETFVVFGFPVTVRAGVTGSVGLDFEFSAGRHACEAGSEHLLEVGADTTFVPYANVRAYAQAGAELLIAEAGVRADLTVIALELPLEASVRAAPIVDDCRGAGPGGVCLEGGANLDFGLEALSGSMSLYLDIDYGIDERHYSRGLFSWPGLRVGPTSLLATDYAFPLSVLHTLLSGGGGSERQPASGNIVSMCVDQQEPMTLAGLLEVVEGQCTPLTVSHTLDGEAFPAQERIAYTLSNYVNSDETFYADAGCQDATRVVELQAGQLTGTVYIMGPAQRLNIELSAPGMQTQSLEIRPAAGGGPATQWLLDGPGQVATGTCVPYSIAAADDNDSLAALSQDITVYLDAVGGRFFSDASCSRPMDELSMLAGDTVATVFFVPDGPAPVLNIAGGALGGNGLDLTALQGPNASFCGDGTLDPVEQCDDGDRDSLDGCSAVCLLERGFECLTPDSPCTEQATVMCNDGIREGFEACDEGAGNGMLCIPDGPDPCWYCDNSCQWQVYVDLVGLFVSASTGDDGAAGTIEAPLATLGEALSRGGTDDIFVAGGTYNGSPPMVTKRRVYGSYNPSTWTVDSDNWRSVISGRYTMAGGQLSDFDLGGLSVRNPAQGESLLVDVVVEGPAVGNPASLVDVQGVLRCSGCDITVLDAVGGQRGVMVWGSAQASLTLESSNVTVPFDAEFVPAVEQRDGADLDIVSNSSISGSIGVRAYYAAADPSGRMAIEDSAVTGGFLGIMSQLTDTQVTRSTVLVGLHIPSGYACNAVQLWNSGPPPTAVIDGSVLRADCVQGPVFAVEGIGEVDLSMVHSAAIATGYSGGTALELDSGRFIAAHSYFQAPGVAGMSFLHASPVTLVNNAFDLANVMYFGQLGTAIEPSGITLVSNRFLQSKATLLQLVGNGGPLQVGPAQYNSCAWGCAEAFANSVGPAGIVDVAGNDFALTGGSALWDSGVDPSSWVVSGLVDHDMYGKARPIGGGWDIGPTEQ